ncbi:hypothetical protein FOA52_011896 [Chlamydomonas sp. UWO 241]|nr:hypothetical protein FOA52_011896 [Chlamydomonas sp. UWO 241]
MERLEWRRRALALVLVALLLFAVPRTSGLQAEAQQQGEQVTLFDSLPGVRRATSEDDLRDLIRGNLLPDLAPWSFPSPTRDRPLSSLDLLQLLHQIDTQWPEYRRNFIAIVAIRSGVISWWAYPAARKWCTARVQYIQDELNLHRAAGTLTLPDTLFVMNAYDKPLCPVGTCSAPLFSFNKPWAAAGGPAAGAMENASSEALPGAGAEVDAGSGGGEGQEQRGQGQEQRVGAGAGVSVAAASGAAASIRAASGDGGGTGASGPAEGGSGGASDGATSSAQPLPRRLHAPRRSTDGGGSSGGSKVAAPASDVAARSTAAAGMSAAAAAGKAAADLAYDDVLFPVLNHPFDTLVAFPWEAKTPTAFLRAGMYAAMDVQCARMQLYKLAQMPVSQGLLDVGIYKNKHWRVKVPLVPPVPIEQHARWRYLLSADGQGASWRLAKLLALDSIVLKVRSSSIEYFYRSLRDGVHYVGVDEGDVVGVVQALEAQQLLQHQAAAQQQLLQQPAAAQQQGQKSVAVQQQAAVQQEATEQQQAVRQQGTAAVRAVQAPAVQAPAVLLPSGAPAPANLTAVAAAAQEFACRYLSQVGGQLNAPSDAFAGVY